MKKILCLLTLTTLLGLAYATPSFASCTWSQTGHVVGIDGTNMPTSFLFKMDVDSGAWSDNPSASTGAYEWVRYDGTLSGNTTTVNTRIVYAQVLAAVISGKTVYNCGPSAYSGSSRDLVSEQIYITN